MANEKAMCPTCSNSILCKTWAEYKCKKLERRIYGYMKLTECKYYKKREKDFKESPCRCEDCLKNELLASEYLEEE